MSTQVVIVGAGPVGLALAIELGMRSVSCVVVERNDRVGYAPRAKTTNVRTRTHLRRWGIADQLAAASPFGTHYPSDVVFLTRLAGYELTRFRNAFNAAPTRSPLYPEHSQWIPQYKLEEVLRAHAQTLPSVDIRFNTEFVSCAQREAGVVVHLRSRVSAAAETTILSDFLVGADGARSTVRSLIGARMTGAYGLSRNYNVVFRAPGLAQAHKHGPAIMYWQVNDEAPSLIGPMDEGEKWFFMPTALAPDVKLSHDDAKALIIRATGIRLPYAVLSSDEWVASRLIADSYRDRRVFLAGDACHLHPPFGGYGMNMGIADAVDLGWKLAAYLQGWGGAGLLDSYELERRPVHERVMEEAVANHAVLGNQLWQPGLENDTPNGRSLRCELGERIQRAKVREFQTLGAVLGYSYEGSPIVVSDGTAASAWDACHYRPSARPGCLAPHAWLDDGTSLYDRFGAGFSLVASVQAHALAHQAQREAHEAGIPLTIVTLEHGQMGELYGAQLCLVRPDQHVAWRGNWWPTPSPLPRIRGFDLGSEPAETAG